MHTTVHIEIHRVTNAPEQPTTRHSPGHPAKREDVQVVNLTARVEGTSEASLMAAIDKAIRHLECERPEREPVNVAERLGYPQ